mmetsp:Transcript_11798/g.16913  ORF Transcript_11798/g.16913 Transcript_11798/m.16913 type:complete len:90 (+) Transcript_11798:341-610(+)
MDVLEGWRQGTIALELGGVPVCDACFIGCVRISGPSSCPRYASAHWPVVFFPWSNSGIVSFLRLLQNQSLGDFNEKGVIVVRCSHFHLG